VIVEGEHVGVPAPLEPRVPEVALSRAVLLELLDDPRPSVRRNAVVALTASGGAPAVRGIAHALTEDPDVDVRREAVSGLRSLVGDRSAAVGGRQDD
jgi:HEAT repeat protein